MLTYLKNTLRRARSIFAASHRVSNLDLPPAISDETARDIGLTPHDITLHRFTWPSQSRDRPLI